MPMPVLPSVAALLSPDEGWLKYELRVAAIRQDAAVVRALMDEIDRFSGAPARAPLEQLADQLSRLGRSALAMASVLVPVPPDRESSVVLAATTPAP